MVSFGVHTHMGVANIAFLLAGAIRIMTKFGEIELVLPDEQMSILTDIRDLLAKEVELSQKVLELIYSVTSPVEDKQDV